MTTYPTPMQSPPPRGGYQPPPSNGLGVAGFIVSLAGLVLTGGFICPLGVLLSLVALGKQPRGFAVAGLITGLLGTALAVIIVFAIMQGAAWVSGFGGQFNTMMTMDAAGWDIDNHYASHNNTLPDQATGNALVGVYTDDWGTALRYQPLPGSTDDYQIISAGQDTQFGTGDDITQSYNAAHSHFGTATPANPFGDEGPSNDQINYAFDQAANEIQSAYKADAALPDEQAGNAAIQNVADAWNSPFRYAPTGDPTRYHLKSAGPDGQWMTKDDITRTFYASPGDF